jgi:hypothetical protein
MTDSEKYGQEEVGGTSDEKLGHMRSDTESNLV